MSEAEKYFIVGDWDDFDAVGFRFQLDPGRCFICESMSRAVCDVLLNKMQGIPASVWTTEGRIGPQRHEELEAA